MATNAQPNYGQAAGLVGATPVGIGDLTKRACSSCGELLYHTELACWKCATPQPSATSAPEASAPIEPQPTAAPSYEASLTPPLPRVTETPMLGALDEMPTIGPPPGLPADPGPAVSGLGSLDASVPAAIPAPPAPIPAVAPPPGVPVTVVASDPAAFVMPESTAAADGRAQTALTYGIISFLCFQLLGPVAIWHGVNARREGSTSPNAIIGIVLGGLATAAMVLSMVLGMLFCGAAMAAGPPPPGVMY